MTQDSTYSVSWYLFEIHDGNLLISMRWLSIFNCALISVVLLVLYWSTCREYNKQCTARKTPFVSGVMVHEMHCRVSILIITLFALTCFMGHILSFYKKLHGLVKPKYLNIMAFMGVMAIVTIPVATVLD